MEKNVRDPRASKMRDHKRRGKRFESSYNYEGLTMKRRDEDKNHTREMRAHVGKIGA